MTPLLAVDNLSVGLDSAQGTVRAVDGVSFSVNAGETFALLGESGCGKSMTALALMRLLPDVGEIAGGRVRLDGDGLLDLSEARMREVRGRHMAMIFQEPATSLNPVMSVGSQIAEALQRHFATSGAEARQRAIELLTAAGIPDAPRRFGEFPFQMSGGMKQRVMVAMALAGEPKLLIADEPTTALDVTIQAQVLDLLAELQSGRGMAILLITHDLGVAARMAHQIGIMYAGHLVEIASRQSLFDTPSHPYTAMLFAALPHSGQRDSALATIKGNVPALTQIFSGCRFADRCPRAWARCVAEAPAWHSVDAADSSHRVRCHLFDSTATTLHDAADDEMPAPVVKTATTQAFATQPLLQVQQLAMYFPLRKGLLKRVVGQVKAVDGVSFTLATGKTLALVGESGCGKTTVGKAILHLLRPTGGTVELEGEDLGQLPAEKLRRKRGAMQMIFQDPFASLNPRLRVGDIIEEGLTALELEPDSARRSRRIDELLTNVGLTPDMRGRYPHEFSGGQRQRIAIARALAVNPRLLICDEPTSALDVSVQAQILNLLKELQARLGLSYLFITHNIVVVDYLAHDVAVMYLGRIVESGSVDDILRHPRHPYTQALLSAVPSITEKDARPVIKLSGDMPSPLNPPSGCHFHPRCPQAMAVCRSAYPPRTSISTTHRVTCYLYGESSPIDSH